MSIDSVGGSSSYDPYSSPEPPPELPPGSDNPVQNAGTPDPAPEPTGPRPEPKAAPTSDELSRKAWEAAAASAAEAYVDSVANAEADRQAEERAKAEAGKGDGVDAAPAAPAGNKPAAGGKTPNGTGGTTGTGGAPTGTGAATGTSGTPGTGSTEQSGTPVALSPTEVADFQKAGIQVTPAGDGTYYINTPIEAVNVTVKADPPPQNVPPPNIQPLPDYTSSVPTGGSSGPTGPSGQPSSPSGVNGVDAGADAGAPQEVTTGLGAAADAHVNKSPSLQAAIKALQDQGVTVRFARPGEKQENHLQRDANGRPSTIVIDPRYANNPTALASSLAHETGHALHVLGPAVGPSGLTKDEYVTRNVNNNLQDEAAATLMGARARAEILENGGPDIGVNASTAANRDFYIGVANDVANGTISEAEGRNRIANHFRDNEKPDQLDVTYGEYYAKNYREWYERNYPNLPPGTPAP